MATLAIRVGLTGPRDYHTLDLLRAVLILSLVAALLSSRIEAAEFHVHVADHEHAQHQHGVAAHHHEIVAHVVSPEPQMTACDPGQHEIGVALSTVTTYHVKAPANESPSFGLLRATPAITRIQPVIDVRVHGPPDRSDRPLRAPPASPFA